MSEKVIIVGSSGHAKVIADILQCSNQYTLVGCVSKDKCASPILGVPIVGDDTALQQIYDVGVRSAFVAIGDNKTRERMLMYVDSIGFTVINAISPHTYISKSVKLGKGIAIMSGAIINPDATIGDNAIINTGATVDHDCNIGANTHIAPGCNLAGNVSVGTGTFLGIGCKAIPKISIGEWSIIGAGSVIVSDISSYSLAYGVPAKVVRKL